MERAIMSPKPPHPPPPPPHGRQRHIPPSAIASFLDDARIDALLEPWIEDSEERAFVVRCLLHEGPAHHRGANFVLLSLMGLLVEAAGPVSPSRQGPSRPVSLRLPPHLAEQAGESGVFPLALPTAPLARLAAPGSTQHEAMVDCLTDGPPQHSLANAAMVCLIDVLMRRLEGAGR
jgi:hypothetical protein